MKRYKVAVAVMVINAEDEFLLVKSRRGWEFPGGFIEDEEAIKDAAIREVKEESGINIELMKFLGLEQDIERTTCVFLFKGRPVSGKLTSSYETEDVGYYPLDEVMNMISIEHFKERIIRCLNDEEIPSIITR
ncbi:NUDIX hydrolase [Metabacillus sp. FJAT-53654]|uniref:NUDIX hydrolase n=1 Tax=Metabacillus rhizosphaerae TaxID=3117747 RepID=A0ABZ2MS05_9BACI